MGPIVCACSTEMFLAFRIALNSEMLKNVGHLTSVFINSCDDKISGNTNNKQQQLIGKVVLSLVNILFELRVR
jgi:hypothetical protein